MTSDIGDERLDARYAILLDRLSQKPSVSIPAACCGKSETAAAYRFFDNDRVNEHEVLKPHQDATLNRMAKHRVVLLLQDTTEFEVTRLEEMMEGAGPLSDEHHVGFHNHAMLALTPERIPLGVINADIWARDWAEFRKNQRDRDSGDKKRKQKSIEEKESMRWLEGYRIGCEVAAQLPEQTMVVISDSEGDIFEYFVESQVDAGEKQAEWIVRACQNRSLPNKNKSGMLDKLWDEVGQAPCSAQ